MLWECLSPHCLWRVCGSSQTLPFQGFTSNPFLSTESRWDEVQSGVKQESWQGNKNRGGKWWQSGQVALWWEKGRKGLNLRKSENKSSWGKWREHRWQLWCSSGELERCCQLKRALFIDKKPSESLTISLQVFLLVTNFPEWLFQTRLSTCWCLFTNNVVQYL